MPDTSDEERQKPPGTTLSVEEWIEELNKHDSFDQYATKRKKERIEKRREERNAEKDESGDETREG
ncbi:hypothetical protein [Salinibacter ruber]|uniref:Uncharacterized protein n=1 Tax=Salinibacter ruber TaxID=146919 RepID=A0A9X2Q9A7_9BACT|nr:hypothetical protein [Salinibacter ruber]MCS3662006.1 hypothetical protein [Salinibacter ruber]MCS3711801.1 hypothetical protein [Salinibacter ruber]MCS4142644.1 hypothetical protein [Salinibacter ruber]